MDVNNKENSTAEPEVAEALNQVRDLMADGKEVVEEQSSNKEGEEEILELNESNIIELDGEENINQAEPVLAPNPSADILDQIDQVLEKPKEEIKEVIAEEAVAENIVKEEPIKKEEIVKEGPVKELQEVSNPENNQLIEPPLIVEEEINKVSLESSEEEKTAKSNDKKDNNLLSEDSQNQTQEALKDLMKKVEKPLTDGLKFRAGTTMEELVTELIKPELSSWLDKHLPNIVKHLVEKEIQKLIPKD